MFMLLYQYGWTVGAKWQTVAVAGAQVSGGDWHVVDEITRNIFYRLFYKILQRSYEKFTPKSNYSTNCTLVPGNDSDVIG